MDMRVKVGWVLSFCAVGCAMQANAAPNEESLTVTMENDTFTGSDNNYTNGIAVSWVSADLNTYEDQRERAEFGTLSMSWDF